MKEDYFSKYFSDILTLTFFFLVTDLTLWLKCAAFVFLSIDRNGVALRSLLKSPCGDILAKVM